MPVAPRIVNDVSHVTGINHACHFTWQAQYLVSCNRRLICHEDEWCQSFFVAGTVPAQNLVMLECHFSWQAKHLVMLECTFRGRRSIW